MLSQPRRAGSFTLLRQIGAGGQADVYLARPADGGPQTALAAVKVARPDHSAALHDEHSWLARAGAAHPGLARLYSDQPADLGYVALCGAGRRLYLALAYVPGQSLAALLAARRGRGLPPAQIVHIARQVAATLEHLHRVLGIAHNDLRPTNLIVGAGPRPPVTLIDLGAAERLGARGRGHIYGAPGYLAPEVLAGAPASPLADLYSLGVTIRQMLGSQNPPPALAAIVCAATAGDPRRRAATIPDMMALLERLRSA